MTTDTLAAPQTRAFAAETARVLHLMIHALYTNRDIFLRELLSNASDACDKLRYAALTDNSLLGGEAELAIHLSFDTAAKTLTIADTGIGMNEADMIENLGTIAKSGTAEFLAQMEATKNPSTHRGEDGRGADTSAALHGSPHPNPPPMGEGVNLIGQFGVGFYASFMVADKVVVHSCKAGEEAAWQWESDGLGSYTITPAVTPSNDGVPLSKAQSGMPSQGRHDKRGTRITLHLKDDALAYLDRHKLGHIAQTYSDHIGFPITLTDSEGVTHKLNDGQAIWTRPKADITPEQYQEFYRHVAHSPEEPWAVLHNKAEGAVEYTSLLFIPGIKPFDLFHPERKRRVKLYVKRVFITDEGVELVPPYLRFLRGVVDSADLPLNISRETLQKSPVLDKIRESVTSRVLSELAKRAERDIADYTTFWEMYGAVLKEGLCEGNAPREKILEACRFYSTHQPVTPSNDGVPLTGAESGMPSQGRHDTLVSLNEYKSRMREGQEAIYFITADSLAQAKSSPQLEGFTKRGIEVLLLTDHVDDFWTGVTVKYGDLPFRSVVKSGADLAQFEAEGGDDAPKPEAENPAAIDALIAAMKTLYGDAVRDVRTTAKLDTTPVCLGVAEGDMDMRMERFLLEHKQLPKAMAKIVEINPTHPVIAALAEDIAAHGTNAATDDTLWLLLDQARIAEGEPVADAAGFARRLSQLMERGLNSAAA
ncbi:MAG: molecular chaperone HtpG [Rickettsiales bacterium]